MKRFAYSSLLALTLAFVRRQASMIAVAVLLFPTAACSQTPEWMNFTCVERVSALADDGDYLWVGMEMGGLIRLNKDTGEMIFYNKANSELPHNTVYALAIDAQGNLWIGTELGLAQFDGENWTVYKTHNSELPHNLVRALTIDAQGNKWIGTDGGGLAKFDGDTTWTVYTTGNSGLPSDRIYALAIDAEGNKWIGTGFGGLAKFDGDTTWTVYKKADSGLPHNYVYALAIDAQGDKWIGTSSGLGEV